MTLGEYSSLQTLHRWNVDFLRADRFEMTYANEIRLSFDCAAFVPDLESSEVVLVKQTQDPATEGLFQLLRADLAQIKTSAQKQTLPKVRPSILPSPSRSVLVLVNNC